MFIATTLLYPCILALLCIGTGLLVDRLCGRVLAAPLLIAVGAATLIGASQLITFVPVLAPATPYAMALLAVGGLVLSRERLGGLWAGARARPWELGGPVVVYVLALAPVLLSGRASFSSYMALADSAVHMLGADFILRHGQSYGHLDLRNSYGQFVNDYYNTSYPSGADTLLGGSAFLLRLPVIWAFQPFNAFILAAAQGPAIVLARRLGLRGGWALAASVTAVIPALVYGYELIGSIKELTALCMLLTSGCLVISHRRWMRAGPAGSVPLALVLAAGTSALGVAFGVWSLIAVLILAVVLAGELRAGRVRPVAAAALVGAATVAGLLAALPTLTDLSGSIQVASNISSTSNPGNLHSPLRAIQVFGIWLNGSYKLEPTGGDLQITHILIVLAFAAVLLGAIRILRIRALALAAWMGLTLLAWFLVSRSVTTWAEAKTLMITSPIVLLAAWAGVGALASLPRRAAAMPAATLVGLALAGGVLVSDGLQYRSSNLAPTARYEEMRSIDARFQGIGPTLFTDFDEYSLYVLHDLDVGGPDFAYPPAALASAAGGYGDPVRLDAISPAALEPYRLIITRRDPTAPRPPAAYRLAWEGKYYQVWQRIPGAPPALAHVALAGPPAAQCARLQSLATGPGGRTAGALIAAEAPLLSRVSFRLSARPRGWGRQRGGFVMNTPGNLTAAFRVPAAGEWKLWIQGQLMPSIDLAVDGRPLATVSGELSGNSLVPDTLPPIRLSLAAGTHTLAVTRPGFNLSPGDRGSAVLDDAFLTPASAHPSGQLRSVTPSRWRELCGGSYRWAELLPA
jgi:hypothetical protein